MNTDISEHEAELSETTEESEKPRKSRSGLAFFALLIALAALAGTAYQWWLETTKQDTTAAQALTAIKQLETSGADANASLRQLKTRLDALSAADDSAEVATLKRRIDSSDQDLAGLRQMSNDQQALSRSLQATIDAQQSRLVAAEAGLANLGGRRQDSSTDLNVFEVDYLLRLASERLQLFSDPLAADQALEMADAHLEAMDNPLYLAVRQRIAESRQKLTAVHLPDYFEIATQLDTVQSSLAVLSFKSPAHDSVATENQGGSQGEADTESGWWAKIKGVFTGLVTVRRSAPEENELLTLEDKDYIRQRMWLQMEIARLTLMRRDQDAFRSSLQRADATLQQWFSQEETTVAAARDSIAQMLKLEIAPQMPDISDAWATLNMIHVSPIRAPPPSDGPILDAMPDNPEEQLMVQPVDQDAETAEEPAGSGADQG